MKKTQTYLIQPLLWRAMHPESPRDSCHSTMFLYCPFALVEEAFSWQRGHDVRSSNNEHDPDFMPD